MQSDWKRNLGICIVVPLGRLKAPAGKGVTSDNGRRVAASHGSADFRPSPDNSKGRSVSQAEAGNDRIV